MRAHLSREHSDANLSSTLNFRTGSLLYMRPLKIWLNFESHGLRGLRAICAWQSPAAASKLWGRGAKIRYVSWSRRIHRLESGEQCSRASWLGSEPQSQWHINRLELEEVFLALKDFRPQLELQHVLIRTDNTSVISYINHRSLQCSVQTGSESPMGGLSLPLHQSSAHPRSLELQGGHAFEEGDSSRRVEVAPRVSSDDLEPLRESGGGSVCHEWEGTLPAVLLSVSLPAGRGRSDIALASSQAEYVSSDQDIATGVMQDQGGASFSDTHGPRGGIQSSFTATIRACKIRWFERAISQNCTVHSFLPSRQLSA